MKQRKKSRAKSKSRSANQRAGVIEITVIVTMIETITATVVSMAQIRTVIGLTRGSIHVAARVVMIGTRTMIAIKITAATGTILPSFILVKEVTMKIVVNAILDEFFFFLCLVQSRDYEKTLKCSGKCFMYGKLLRHTNKVSLRFLLRDTLHEAFFTGYQEGNVDNHS